MGRTERQRAELRQKVRELLLNGPVTVQLAALPEGDTSDALLEGLLEIVLEYIHDAGGFCDYEWHIASAAFHGAFTRADGQELCGSCGRTRAEHATHPVLLCPDELEHVLAMEIKASPQ